MTEQRDRKTEIAAGLQAVRDRIDQARRDSGRSDAVDLLVVTKTFPASDVDFLAELGVSDVGENKDQEARSKKDAVVSTSLRWHMIGHLQSNKTGSVSSWADVVETVDRERLVSRLAEGVQRRSTGTDKPVVALIQVNLDPKRDAGRSGAEPDEVPRIAEAISQWEPWLRLGGVMAVAPHPQTGMDPRAAFDQLAAVHARLLSDWPQATTMSAGMSGDLEAAVAAGATQVRIGGAILGQRPPVQ